MQVSARAHMAAALALGASLAASTAALAQPTQSAGHAGHMGGACGQPTALTYTLPMPLDQAAMAPLTTTLERAEPIYLEFALSAAGRVVFRSGTEDSETDPYLTLYDRTGQIMTEDDDGAGGYNALVDVALDAGTYCVQLHAYSPMVNRFAPMTLMAATGEAAEELAARLEPGAADIAALCTDPALTSEVPGALGPGLGEMMLDARVPEGLHSDWIFQVDSPMSLQVDAIGRNLDTMLVLAADGMLIAENDDGPIDTDSRIAVELEPGSYCLSLSGFDGAGGEAQLRLSDELDAPMTSDLSAACTDPDLTNAFGWPVQAGMGIAEVGGSLDYGARSDWSIEVRQEMTVQVDVRSMAFDTVLNIVDETGMVIDYNDDGIGTGTDSRIVRTLVPGRYCLAVEALGGGEGAFDLAITDEPEAVPGDVLDTPMCSDPEMTDALGAEIAPGFGGLTVPVMIGSGARQDWSFVVTEATDLRIDARGRDFDTLLQFGDATGIVLQENDDGPTGTDSQLEMTILPGTYCLGLSGFAGASGAGELVLTEMDAATRAGESVARGEGVPAPGSAEIEELGALIDGLQTSAPSQAQTKWVAFSLDAGAEVRIDAVSASGSFMLRLFTEAGDLVAEEWGAGGFSPTRLNEALHPGRYLVGMSLDDPSGSKLRTLAITRRGAE